MECEHRVSEPYASETYVSELRCKVNIYFIMAKVRKELKSPHPQRFETGLFDPPLTDLRDYLMKNWSVHQITP